jgi:hypothetical protein
MKTCPTCQRQYEDPSLKFCTQDGTALTPRFDSEAETQEIRELTADDIVMEIADYLGKLRAALGREVLVRFEDMRSLGFNLDQINENFATAAKKASFQVISKTDTRATIRKRGRAFLV